LGKLAESGAVGGLGGLKFEISQEIENSLVKKSISFLILLIDTTSQKIENSI